MFMVSGKYSLFSASKIEECKSFCYLCNKSYHILQYVLLRNEVRQGSMHWEFDITGATVF
jgi:hypothetical protein